MTRELLPQRRPAETVEFQVEGQKFTATVGFNEAGHPREIFLNLTKRDQLLDHIAADSAVAISIALQYGAPIDVLRKAMRRDAFGNPQGVAGAVLDLLEENQ